MSRLNLLKMFFWRSQCDSGQPPSLLFCMPLQFECLMHQILICHSFILDSSFILRVMWLTGEMCSTSSLSVEICYLGLTRGFEFDFPSALHLKFSCLWQRQTNLQCSNMKKCFSSQQFMDTVERYCMPVAVISLSCILISFLTVLISDCSASHRPLYPSATSFEKGKHALNTR